MPRIVNPNLQFLHDSYFLHKKSGVLLEGSSRSAKTWSGVDFIILLCSKFETSATINIYKETYNSFKTTLYEDFNRRLPMYGITSPFANRKEVSSFFLFGNKINFLGADSDTVVHGAGCDYLFFNEILDIPQSIFDQAEQRCRKFWWADYNPKATQHWVYDRIEKRSDVGFLKTTFLDNPFLSLMERRKLLSYEPTHPEDRKLSKDLRRPHPTNIAEGTADDYMWGVYGLGLRSAPEGLVFTDINWVDEFPSDIEKVYYGSDIGKTNSPSVVTKIGVNKLSTATEKGNLYLECLAYEPTPSTIDYIKLLNSCKLIPYTDVWADSAEPGYISAARQADHRVLAVKKFPGSIVYGISMLKSYRIHIVRNRFYSYVEKEVNNYKYREINGIRLDEPVDDFNHFWDSVRYAVLMSLRN